MKLKPRAIQILETWLKPTEMGAIYLMGMGILEMPETVTKSDLTNIVVSLCCQLDWIVYNEEESSNLSTEAVATSLEDSEKVKENFWNYNTKTQDESNVEGAVQTMQNCVEDEVPITFSATPTEILSKSEDKSVDYYSDILFEGTKIYESVNEDKNIKKNDLDMVFEEYKTESSIKISEDLTDADKLDTIDTDHNTSTEHYESIIIKSELDDGKKSSEENILSDLKDDEPYQIEKKTSSEESAMCSNDPSTSAIDSENYYNPTQKSDAAKTMSDKLTIFFNCTTCDANFAHRMGLENHIKVNTNKDGSMRCGKKGAKRDLSKPRPFHCQSCDKSFTEERFLKTHVESSHKKVRHACHLCDKEFSQKSVLARHIKTVHDVISKQCCVTCGLTFSQKNILVRHIKTVHNKLKTHMCSDCGKMFREARELKRHFDAVHIGLKPFKCQVCDKMFSQSVHRDAHIKNVHQVSPL